MATKKSASGAKKSVKASKKAAKRAGVAKKSVKAAKGAAKAAAPSVASQELSLRIAPQGPTPEVFAALARELPQHPALRDLLNKTRNRVLSVEMVEPQPESKSARTPAPSDRFRATIYDYTNNRALIAEGSLSNRRQLAVTESAQQPLPNDEEFNEAVQLLGRDAGIGPLLRDGSVQPYRAMPPLLGAQQHDGRVERTVSVGLLPLKAGAPHEIVGVNIGRKTVMRFEERAPANAAAHNPICGQPNTGQATASKGTPGQVWVTVTQGGTTLWKFLAVRAAASSGTNGSGVELRYVDYRGKRVLYQAHVPILNVKYSKPPCGPYRDWQYQESMIQANGTDVAPGFRLCSSPATTILDNGSDSGNFLDRDYLYTRLELVDKDDLLRPSERALLGITEDHPSFRIGAYTFGGARDICDTDKVSLAVGSDLTFYSKPAILDPVYGQRPIAWKIFFRIRPGKMDMSMGGMHGGGTGQDQQPKQ